VLDADRSAGRAAVLDALLDAWRAVWLDEGRDAGRSAALAVRSAGRAAWRAAVLAAGQAADRAAVLDAGRAAVLDAERVAGRAAALVVVGLGNMAVMLTLWLAAPLVRVMATKSPANTDDLNYRTARVVKLWARFGCFLLPRSKKLFEYDLAEHAADLYEALDDAETRREQDRLIRLFTLAAVAKVLDRLRVAFQNRLRDEFDWVARRSPRN
jgi:hypothetical protein